MNRREFLKKGAVAVAGAAVGSSILGTLTAAKAPSGAPKKMIGLQLYSLRDAMKKDPEATLRLVADIGYREVETAGYYDGKLYGYDPKAFRKMVEGMGMKVTSAHVNPPKSLYDDDAAMTEWWSKCIDTQKAAGCRYIVQPSVPLPENMDGLKKIVVYFDRVGAMAAKKGLKFGFHNHDKEFKQVDGNIIYDYFIRNTDPKKVFYQMDVYWVVKGGGDPVDYLAKYPGRFPNLHIKDEFIIGDSGLMDFESIFNAAYKHGVKDYFVEVERYTDTPEKCVRISYNYLTNAGFVK